MSVNQWLRRLGFELRRTRQREEQLFASLRTLRTELYRNPAEGDFLRVCCDGLSLSHGQLFQDLMVSFFLDGKRDGYFVEFGASDGKMRSNTYMLEEHLGWSGILAEPGRCWHHRLKENRANSIIDTRCVWTRSGESLLFRETDFAELSTLADYSTQDDLARDRAQVADEYEVATVSLNDLLAEHQAPAQIDYVSMDTEGSELDILKAFDFDRHRCSIFSVEHNFSTRQGELDALFRNQGYRRVLQEYSSFDAWFVLPELAARLDD